MGGVTPGRETGLGEVTRPLLLDPEVVSGYTWKGMNSAHQEPEASRRIYDSRDIRSNPNNKRSSQCLEECPDYHESRVETEGTYEVGFLGLFGSWVNLVTLAYVFGSERSSAILVGTTWIF